MTGKRLYIFNPEHDLALASGESHYMAPASARQMASDLALLPVWYAGDGNAVLAPSAYAADFLKEMQERLGMRVELVTPPKWRMRQAIRFLRGDGIRLCGDGCFRWAPPNRASLPPVVWKR